MEDRIHWSCHRLRNFPPRRPAVLVTVFVEMLIFGLFAMSLDLIVGYCRLLVRSPAAYWDRRVLGSRYPNEDEILTTNRNFFAVEHHYVDCTVRSRLGL